jgi:hypothetical protein
MAFKTSNDLPLKHLTDRLPLASLILEEVQPEEVLDLAGSLLLQQPCLLKHRFLLEFALRLTFPLIVRNSRTHHKQRLSACDKRKRRGALACSEEQRRQILLDEIDNLNRTLYTPAYFEQELFRSLMLAVNKGTKRRLHTWNGDFREEVGADSLLTFVNKLLSQQNTPSDEMTVGQLMAWLNCVAKNKGFEHSRERTKQTAKRSFVDDMTAFPDLLDQEDLEAADHAENCRQFLPQIMAAAPLDALDRLILDRNILHGISLVQIARDLDMPPNTIYCRKKRALATLRNTAMRIFPSEQTPVDKRRDSA